MNKELAARVVALIEANPLNFNMENWAEWAGTLAPYNPKAVILESFEGSAACSTTLCAAGWASVAAGNSLVWNPATKTTDAISPDGTLVANGRSVGEGSFFQHGAELLGISFDHADTLFTTTEVRALRALKLIAAGDGDWYAKVFEFSFENGFGYDEDYEDGYDD